jgi:hypothetical protein
MPKNPMKHTRTLCVSEEILQVINENFIEMILDMVNQMYRRHSRTPRLQK